MTISSIIAQQKGDQGASPRVNPFPQIEFTKLDEALPHLVGKLFLSVVDEVVKHMSEHGIHAACIYCSGTIGSSRNRHFIKMDEVPRLVPEVTDTLHLIPLIHQDLPLGIVALKIGALNAEFN